MSQFVFDLSTMTSKASLRQALPFDKSSGATFLGNPWRALKSLDPGAPPVGKVIREDEKNPIAPPNKKPPALEVFQIRNTEPQTLGSAPAD